MKTLVILIATTVVIAAALPAEATVLDFTMTGAVTANWTIDTSTVSMTPSGTFFVVSNIAISPGVTADIRFYTAASDGGLQAYSSNHDYNFVYDSTPLFTGATASPTFKLGTFSLNGIHYGWGLSTLSIAEAASPTPEPTSWAMMLAGFGAIGGAMRSRRKAVVSFG